MNLCLQSTASILPLSFFISKLPQSYCSRETKLQSKARGPKPILVETNLNIEWVVDDHMLEPSMKHITVSTKSQVCKDWAL